LVASLEAVHAELSQQLKLLTGLKKGVELLRAKGALQRLDLLTESNEKLAEAVPSNEHLSGAWSAMRELLREQEQLRRAGLRAELLTALSQRAQREEIAFQLLSEHPLEVLLSPLVLSLDLDKGRGQLEYAREGLVEVESEVSAIFEARKKAMERLRKQATEAPVFFEHLVSAYRLTLLHQGKSFGEAVELVDLLLPLSLVSVETKRWRSTSLAKLPEMSRALFAYQLHRLRQQGLLEYKGQRIDLGTATGGSTKDKRNVLFIPVSPTEGQYYLSLRVHRI
jgi:hypothetical protein